MMHTFKRFYLSVIITALLPFQTASASFLTVADDAVTSRGEFLRAVIRDLEIGLTRGCTMEKEYERPIPVGYAPYVCEAEKRGVLEMFKGDLGLGRTITRGEALILATELANAEAETKADITFSDVQTAALKKAVQIALEKNLMNPLRPGLFGAGRALTGREGRSFLEALTGHTDGSPSVPVTHIRLQTKEQAAIPERDLLQTVWQLLHDQYLYENNIDSTEAGYAAAEGLVESLKDPYTVFLRPLDTKNFNLQLDGELSGIGAQVEYSNDSLLIVAPLAGSPAEKAGIKPGDRIVEVDGSSIAGLTLYEAVELVRGKRGTSVKLGIDRNGTMMDITVTRDTVRLPEIDISFQGDIALVKLAQFGQTTDTKLRSLLQDVQKEKPSGIILDLRNNPGGLLHAAETVLSNFLPQGSSIAQIGTKKEDFSDDTSDAPTIDSSIPLVVLINGGSASASEIVAGALQDYKRATIVGEKSFGKGTVQQIIEFRDGSSLKMTIAEWYTPKGRKINDVGVEPDVLVKQSEDRDDQMLKALELLR